MSDYWVMANTNTSRNINPTSKLGVVVARTILTGDITLARREAAGRCSWSVSEARAITGACREANRRWGCELSLKQFTEAK